MIRAENSSSAGSRVARPLDGRVAWLEESGRASRDPATGAVRLTGLVTDATARKRAEEALRASELGRPAGAMARALLGK